MGGGTTDEKGSFRLRNIPEGTYYIGASPREEGTGNVAYRGRQKIEVAGDNIDSLTISLGAGATIQGRVKVGGAKSVTLDRIRLSLMPVGEDGQWGGPGNVKNDGSFEIESVPDGSYAFSVCGLEHDFLVKSVRRGPDDLLEKGLQVEGSFPVRVKVIINSDGRANGRLRSLQ